MLGSPINYSLSNSFDPFDAVSQGRAQGIQFRQSAEKRQRTQEMQSKLAGYANQDGGVTVEDIEKIRTEYPEMGDHFDKTYERLDQEQKQSSINTMFPVYSMLTEGRNDDAVEMLEQIKEGNLNAGDQDGANAVDAQIKLIQSNPKSAQLGMTMALSSLMPAGEFRHLTKLKKKKVKTDFFTNTKTGEVSALGIDPETGEKVFSKTFPGVRRSSSLTPEEKAKAAAAVTTEKNKADLPYIEEKEQRALARQRTKELIAMKRSKDYRNVSQGLSSVLDAIDIFEANPNIKSLSGEFFRKLGRGEAGKFEVAIKDATDLLTRIRTGQALNSQEIVFYNTQYTPKWYNDDETANLKLQKLKQIFEESEKRMIDPDHVRVDVKEFFSDSVLDFEKELGRSLTSEEILELQGLGEL